MTGNSRTRKITQLAERGRKKKTKEAKSYRSLISSLIFSKESVYYTFNYNSSKPNHPWWKRNIDQLSNNKKQNQKKTQTNPPYQHQKEKEKLPICHFYPTIKGSSHNKR